MHMFSTRNVYRNMWELCDAYLRLRLMQTWWHRPHQMCQMKIQFERIEKPYSKILIPIYIYICSEDLKSYPSQCSTIMVCILLHLSSVSQQPWEATFQHQVRKNWPFEPVFFPAVCAWQATKYTLFFLLPRQKNSVCWVFRRWGNGRSISYFCPYRDPSPLESKQGIVGSWSWELCEEVVRSQTFLFDRSSWRVFHVTLFWRNSRIRSMIVFFHRPRP